MQQSNRFDVDPEVTFQKLGDETVLVHMGTGRIHHANPTGSRVWELLSDGRTVGEVLETLEGEFDAPAEQLRDEVTVFVEGLSKEKMIRPVEEGA